MRFRALCKELGLVFYVGPPIRCRRGGRGPSRGGGRHGARASRRGPASSSMRVGMPRWRRVSTGCSGRNARRRRGQGSEGWSPASSSLTHDRGAETVAPAVAPWCHPHVRADTWIQVPVSSGVRLSSLDRTLRRMGFAIDDRPGDRGVRRDSHPWRACEAPGGALRAHRSRRSRGRAGSYGASALGPEQRRVDPEVRLPCRSVARCASAPRSRVLAEVYRSRALRPPSLLLRDVLGPCGRLSWPRSRALVSGIAPCPFAGPVALVTPMGLAQSGSSVVMIEVLVPIFSAMTTSSSSELSFTWIVSMVCHPERRFAKAWCHRLRISFPARGVRLRGRAVVLARC